MFYHLPAKLAYEQAQFAHDIKDYVLGVIDGTRFKALRVAHGVYEQRQNDTYMIRIRCASGAVAPYQVRRVAELAARYGNDEVHFTTRQELQIHDVLLQDVVTVLGELRAVGLSTRGGGGNTIRNILTSQDAGITTEEAFDPDPYAMALTTRMVHEGDSWDLPRKFKIAFSNNEADTAFTQATCLGFLATSIDCTGKQRKRKGFKVFCAGGMGAKPMVGHCLIEFIPVEQVYHVTRALKTMFDKYGNRRSKTTSRIKFLWKKLDREGFEKLFYEEYHRIKDDASLALDIRPFTFPNAPTGPTIAATTTATHSPVLSPIAITEIALQPLEVTAADEASFQLWKQRYVLEQKQAGLLSIRIPLRLGDLKRVDAERLCNFLQPIGQNTLRCGRNQNIILRNIPKLFIGNAYYLIMGMEQTLVRFPSFFSNMINCTGASTCKLGICLPRGLSDAIRARLARSTLPLDRLEKFRLNMSGCPNTCGMHHIAHLGFFGKVLRKKGHMYPGYNVLAGARVGYGKTVYAAKYGEVAAKHIPEFVHDFLAHYLSVQAEYTDYYAYLEACGYDKIRSLCEKFAEVPDFDMDKDFYTDFGAKKVISLDEIGTAECSAGMFDMIGVDRKTIRMARKTLQALGQSAPPLPAEHVATIETLLYKIAFATARMLLVTRGLEGKTALQVFELFSKHFITTGLVPEKYLVVMDRAKAAVAAKKIPIASEEPVLQCAALVEELYQSMDDSLRFLKPLPRPVAALS